MQTSRPDCRHARLLLAILLPIALIAVLAALAGNVQLATAAAVPYARPAAVRAGLVVTPVAYFPVVFKPWPACAAPPCLLSPQNGEKITTLAPLFVWGAGSSAAGQAWTDFSPVPASTVSCRSGCTFPGSGVVSVRGLGWLWSSRYRFDANLQPGTTYSWGIKRCNSGGQCQQSETWTFTTPGIVKLLPAPAVITPTSGSVVPGPQVNLEWSPVSGAMAYEFCLSLAYTTPYFRNCTWVEATAQTVQLSGVYYWHVAALGPQGEGPGVLGVITVTAARAGPPIAGPPPAWSSSSGPDKVTRPVAATPDWRIPDWMLEYKAHSITFAAGGGYVKSKKIEPRPGPLYASGSDGCCILASLCVPGRTGRRRTEPRSWHRFLRPQVESWRN